MATLQDSPPIKPGYNTSELFLRLTFPTQTKPDPNDGSGFAFTFYQSVNSVALILREEDRTQTYKNR